MNLRLALAISDRPAQAYTSKTRRHKNQNHQAKIRAGTFHPRQGQNERTPSTETPCGEKTWRPRLNQEVDLVPQKQVKT